MSPMEHPETGESLRWGPAGMSCTRLPGRTPGCAAAVYCEFRGV